MRLHLSLFLTVLSVWALANSRIDSLKYELFNHTSEDVVKVELLNNLGYEYWIINPVQSIIYGQQAKVLAEILKDSSGLAFSNRVIGVAHWARGSYDRGLEYLLDGLSLYRNLSDTLGEANCLMNIGLIYADRSDNDLALEYYFEALKFFESVGAANRSATTYVKLATIFIRQRDFSAAYDFLRRAEYIHGSDEFLYGISEILNRYGLLKTETQEYDSAILYLNHSMEVSQKIQDIDGIIRNYISLADVALQTNRIDDAETFLDEALVAARKVQSHKWLKEIYSRLQRIARRKGNLEKAIVYLDQYVQQKDSIFNEQTLNNISRLETELATAEQKRQLDAKENEIVILEQESEIQRSRILVLFVIMATVIISAILFIRNRQLSAQRKEQIAKKEADEARKELEFKNRELVSYTVNFVQKNQLFEELMNSVSTMKKSTSDDTRKGLIGMERTIKRHLQIDRDWEDFKMRFENLHTGFFDKILEKEASLTGNDLKLCALVKMNFSIKEISEMMGISTESVKTARYRLKKKLNLPGDMALNDFLNTVS
ncbi:tetratricopeptide repeat protein [Ekhidna sp. To15]|uniref:tetratricopeptide repeat protein n=1 Tax=Ekhidna sp. To15 TaxID=3395267 RepID=UPI003F521B72